MTTETTSDPDISTYSGMFEEYVAGQAWIGPADTPLVFHLRQLCRQLDAKSSEGGEVKAALSSTYLQAFERLDRRRPRPTGPAGDGLLPPAEQPSIFDTMD